MYVYTQDVPIDFALYRRVIDALGPEPLKGSLLHLCVRRPDGGLRYIDVWETEDACAKLRKIGASRSWMAVTARA